MLDEARNPSQPSQVPFRKRLLLAASCSLFVCAMAYTQQSQATGETLRGLDPRVMDLGADPCVDFARYACGNFNKLYPIRPDEMASTPTAGASAQISAVLKTILEADASPADHTSEQRLLGNYYAACLNGDSVKAKGLAALKPILFAIDQFSDKTQLPALLAKIQMLDGESFFRVYAFADELHVGRTIVALDQPSFGLQTSENYASTDPKLVVLREQYSKHIATLLALSGQDEQNGRRLAENIVVLESQLVRSFPLPAAAVIPSLVITRLRWMSLTS